MSQIYLAGPFFRGANRSSKSYRKSVGGKQNSHKFLLSTSSPRKQLWTIQRWMGAGSIRKRYGRTDKCRICCCYPWLWASNNRSRNGLRIRCGNYVEKPMIIVQEETVPTNLMITQSLHTYLKSDQAVREYDFETLPVETYVGEYL